MAAFGSPQGLAFSASDGIVSGIRTGKELKENPFLAPFEFDPDMTWIQTTAPISGGNSGGPLVNSKAELVGVNTLGLGDAGKGVENLNLAISYCDIRSALDECEKSSVRPLPSNQLAAQGTNSSPAPPGPLLDLRKTQEGRVLFHAMRSPQLIVVGNNGLNLSFGALGNLLGRQAATSLKRNKLRVVEQTDLAHLAPEKSTISIHVRIEGGRFATRETLAVVTDTRITAPIQGADGSYRYVLIWSDEQKVEAPRGVTETTKMDKALQNLIKKCLQSTFERFDREFEADN